MALLFHSPDEDAQAWRRALLRHAPELDVRLWPELGDPAGAREDLREALRQALEAKDEALGAQIEQELGKLP